MLDTTVLEYASKIFTIPIANLQVNSFSGLKDMLAFCFAQKPELLRRTMQREQVVAAYHCFLGRAPESEQVISESMQARLYDKVDDFCHSDEFRSKYGFAINCFSLLQDKIGFAKIVFRSNYFEDKYPYIYIYIYIWIKAHMILRPRSTVKMMVM